MRFAFAAIVRLCPWRPYGLGRRRVGMRHRLLPRPWTVRLSRWQRFGASGGALQRVLRRRHFRRRGAPLWQPALPARFAPVCKGPLAVTAWHSYTQAGSSASHEVLFPFSACCRAALSAGATRRTIPLRLWLAFYGSTGGSLHAKKVEPASVPLRFFAATVTPATVGCRIVRLARCGSCIGAL